MRKLISLLTILVFFTNVFAQEYTIDDFQSIDDWQMIQYYGMSAEVTMFSANSTPSIHLSNNLNYGDELMKPLNIVKSDLRNDRIVFWFYSNNSYTDIVLKIVDKGGNERCKASITFGMETGVWHLFNRSIIDFQDCKNKYMNSLGSISFYLNDYPSDFYAGPIILHASNLTDEDFTSDPGWVYIYDVEVSPTLSPKGKPVSISCKVMAENFIDNVTVNIFNEGYNQTSFMEKIIGNLSQGTYRYIFDPQPQDPDGTYFFRISAVDYGGNSTQSNIHTFTINSTLRISFDTDKQVYNLSDMMYITGTAKDINYNDVPGNLTVNLTNAGWSDTFSDGGFFGTFDVSYNLSEPPPGIVNLELFFDDNHGNTGLADGSIYVNDPYQQMNYTLLVYSPENNTSYFEGDLVELEAILLQGPNHIIDANMTAIIGQNQVSIPFSGDSYKIGFTPDKVGYLETTFIGSKGDFIGINSSYIFVQELPDVDPYNPPPGFPGGGLPISFNITFENGTPMSDLNVSANSPTGQIPLEEVEPGIYNGTYTPGFGDTGQWNMTIDINGNTIDTELTISVNLLSLEAIVIIIVLVIVSVFIIMKIRGV